MKTLALAFPLAVFHSLVAVRDRVSARLQAAVSDDSLWKDQNYLRPPDLEDVVALEAPRLLRNTHYAVVVLFLTLIVIASVTHVDMIIAATGRIVTDAPTVVVQPMQLSIIREIRVKPGDIVHKGDILATLDPTFGQADEATLVAQQKSVEAQIARIEAELAGGKPALDAKTPDAILQLTLFSQRRSQYDARLRSLDEDLDKFQTAIGAAERNRISLEQQLAIAREVEDMRGRLYRLQVGSKLNHLDSQVLRMRNDRDYEDAATRLDELKHSYAAKVAERQVFIDDWRRALLEELVKARAEAASVTESLIKSRRLNDFATLAAPVDGVVLEIAKRSNGSVMQAAEPLVTLVPAGSRLIADVMINSADVGYTKEGDKVAIKLDAFPYQRHGLLSGKLRSVGEDSTSSAGTSAAIPASGQPIYHRSQIEITDMTLQHLPESARIIPGMTLVAEINVGSRSVISYFLYPITRGFSESIREP